MQSQDTDRVQYNMIAIVEICDIKKEAQSLGIMWVTKRGIDTAPRKVVPVLAAAHRPEQ